MLFKDPLPHSSCYIVVRAMIEEGLFRWSCLGGRNRQTDRQIRIQIEMNRLVLYIDTADGWIG